jgi:hypothetical protein
MIAYVWLCEFEELETQEQPALNAQIALCDKA